LEPIAENSLRDQILKGKEDISLGLVITMGIKLVIQHQLMQRVVLIQLQGDRHNNPYKNKFQVDTHNNPW
jgi:hypothetical protein